MSIDIAEFNSEIETAHKSGENWTKDPITISHKLFPFYMTEGQSNLSIECTRHSDTVMTVNITHEGAMDDSVSGEKRILAFEYKDNRWTINSVRLGFKCWEHRGGHTNYSGIICP